MNGDRVVVGAVIVAAAIVVVGFVVALAARAPLDGIGLVVVGEPGAAVAAPVRVLGLHRGRAVPITATIDDVAVDADGLGTLSPSGPRVVRGTARIAGDTRRFTLALPPTIAASPSTTTVLTTTPWTMALAMPVQGAAVYPATGLVRGRDRTSVVLVDDDGVEIVEVDPRRDQRLPDGRLLAIDRRPLQIVGVDVVGDRVVLTLRSHEALRALASIWIDDRFVAFPALDVASGQETHMIPVPADAVVDGAIVVVDVAASMLPSAPVQQIVTRVGGLTRDDLIRIEPRALHDLDRQVVRDALGRRLAVVDRKPMVLSPSIDAQERAWRNDAVVVAAAARHRFRVVVGVVVVVLVLAGVRSRARPLPLLLALGSIIAVVLGLDAVLGLDDDDVAADVVTSGSP